MHYTFIGYKQELYYTLDVGLYSYYEVNVHGVCVVVIVHCSPNFFHDYNRIICTH